MIRLWLFALLVLLLAACGGRAEEAVTLETAESEIPLALPDTVDVATVSEVRERDDVVVLDVREQWEYDEGHIPGVTLIPMAEIADRIDEVPTDKTIIVTCRSGNRSGQVTDYLRQQGYDDVHNMEGGILAWEAAGYDVER
jgi:rhodanese-related sulfurtransferase